MSLGSVTAEQISRLAVLAANEAELVEGTDAALAVLGVPTDSIKLRGALLILMRARRFDEANALICDRRLDERWVDLAAQVFAYQRDLTNAKRCIDAADESSDATVVRRARVALAEGIVDRLRDTYAKESLLSKTEWTPAEKDTARYTLTALDPILSLVRANRSMQTSLEVAAVTYAIYVAHINNIKDAVDKCGKLLLNHTPIPLLVAELCLRSIMKCPDSIPTRLRRDHPSDFQAAYLAALLERDLFDRHRDAFAALVALSEKATSESEKDAAALALFETAGRCGSIELKRTAEILRLLQPQNTLWIGVLESAQFLAGDDLTSSRRRLEEVREEKDAVWWQAHAQLCEREKRDDEAQLAWEKASELLPHPDVMRRCVQASLARKRYGSAVRSLLALLAKKPDSGPELNNLAWAYMQLGDFAQATPHLQRLVRLFPGHAEHRLALAHCLTNTAHIGEAIDVLKPLCEVAAPRLNVILYQSQLLQAASRVSEAFRLLESVASNHWDEPRFVVEYMHASHAAGQDALASKAFARLVDLRQQGQVPKELMQEGTLEQLLERGRAFQSRRELLHGKIVNGQMPWLFAEEVLNNAPVWAWTLHTQELAWLSEESLTRAAFSIYSTNGFMVRPGGVERPLRRIECSKPGLPVVVDLSALITLHQLGILEDVTKYAGTIVLPQSYGGIRVRDADKFGQHQPSREEELKAIDKEVRKGRIRAISFTGSSGLLIDEYGEHSDEALKFRDLLEELQRIQRVSPEASNELLDIAHKPKNATKTLRAGDCVRIALSSLRSLANRKIFDSTLSAFDVCIAQEDVTEVARELNAYDVARGAKAAHDSLWSCVASLADRGEVSWQPLGEEHLSKNDDLSDFEAASLYFDSLKVAKSRSLPLLVDDRVLQVLSLQEELDTVPVVFGTDALIEQMWRTRSFAVAKGASLFRTLMRWRYRFIIPSSEMMRAWAIESMPDLPGDALLDVSFYLHDCLRDPGLHCGLEQSDPPMPMAARLVTSWTEEIVGFLAAVWSDAAFSDSAATFLTKWAGEELLPSCPKGLWLSDIGGNVPTAVAQGAIQMAIVQFTCIEDVRRANAAIRALTKAIGKTDEDLLKIGVEAINAVD